MDVQHASQDPDCYTLSLGKDEIEDLADAIMAKTSKLPRSVLDLGYLLRQGQYSFRDSFRQPPHAFDSQAPKQPSVEG
jgi:hypothetical protein